MHHRFMAVLVAIGLAACAPEIERERAVLAPVPAAQPVRDLIVARTTHIQLSSNYTRVLVAGSRWSPVGTLGRGTVYRPSDGAIFTIEGANVHEAYLVVSEGMLVGFYLPGESAASWLARPLALEAN